jgi:hypothetical protein
VIGRLFAAALTAAALAAVSGQAPRRVDRALWVWDAGPLLEGGAARAEFLAFCRNRGITIVWIQANAERGRLDRADDWRRLLGDAHAHGLRVHALDGAPEYSRAANHAKVVDFAAAVLAFNSRSRDAERFDGIHLDNEPYLLPEWTDPALREGLLAQFLALNARVAAMTRNAQGVEFGIDVPFWWQARDAETGEAIGIVTFNGVRKAATYHLMDLVDNLGIMDYRNAAGGDDGIIAHATDLLVYADRSRARVFVGVETGLDPPRPYWFVAGVPTPAIRRELRGQDGLLAGRDLRLVTDGALVHVGVASADRDAERRLASIASALGAPVMDGQGRRALESGARALAEAGEWRAVAIDPIVDGPGRAFGGLRALWTMPPKLTFAGRSNEEMDRELVIAERSFGMFAGWAGMAIHHYGSYRARFLAAGAHERDR